MSHMTYLCGLELGGKTELSRKTALCIVSPTKLSSSTFVRGTPHDSHTNLY